MGVTVLVALRKESVDRNVNLRVLDGSKSSSLSARRAWIEIFPASLCDLSDCVALRKESVDRNTDPINLSDIPPNVALRKESVDRNACIGFH